MKASSGLKRWFRGDSEGEAGDAVTPKPFEAEARSHLKAEPEAGSAQPNEEEVTDHVKILYHRPIVAMVIAF